MVDYFKKKEISSRAEDEILYEYVMDEMEQQEKPIKGLWAKAVAHSDGDNEKAKSLYMQFRVQSIKDDFESLRIMYNELSKEQLFETIKNGFKDQHEKFKIKKEQEVKKEKEKYNKIGGWLILFAIMLILGNLASLGYISQYFGNEFQNTLELLYLNNQSEIAGYINKMVYIEFVAVFIVILFIITFFTKSNITKTVTIVFFISKLILVPISIYLLIKIDPELNGMSKEFGKMMGSSIWAIILLLYFIFSTRVKKTFVKQKDNTIIIGISLVIPILLMFGYNSKINDISSSWNLQYKAEELADKSFDKNDYKDAIKWYNYSVKKGNKSAKFRLAYSYNKIKDYENAIKYYLEYIKTGEDAGAMRNLGLVYENAKQNKEAQKWFKKAFNIYLDNSNKGDKKAMKWLSVMYEYGEGTKKHSKKSKFWKDKIK